MKSAAALISLAGLALGGCSSNDHDGGKRVGGSTAQQIRQSVHEDAATKGGVASFSFEDAEVGSVPRGWRVAETSGAGKPATWRVEQDPKAPSGARLLRLAETKNAGGTFNLLLSESAHSPDLELAVKVRADAGEEDRGGGLVWRVKDRD